MATFKGTVRKSDLEGGVWELHGDDGVRYQLRGENGGLHVDGQRVSVEGDLDDGAMGFGMSGPTLDVTRWKKA